MLNLWLVVLLGFVASARGEGGGGGRLYSFMSHEAVEKQFKRICDENRKYFKPTNTVIPDVKHCTQSEGNHTGLNIDDVRMDSLSLNRDFLRLNITLSVTLSSNEVKNLQLTVYLTIGMSWAVSPNGYPEVATPKTSMDLSLKSSHEPPKQDLAENLSACHSFLKTHFGACFKGILGIFNENLKSGGGYRRASVKSVATDVSIVGKMLCITQKLVDQNGKEIPCDGNRNIPPLTRGQGWGTILTNDLIKTLWRNAMKSCTPQRKWPSSPFQKYFNSDLGSSVNLAISMDDARSCNINSKGINISTGANLKFSSESREPLLLFAVTVEVSVKLGAKRGSVTLVYINIRIVGSWKQKWQHSGGTSDNVLRSLAGDNQTVLADAIDEFVGDSHILFSPGVPQCFLDGNYVPTICCYDEGYCILMYREAS